MRKRKDDDVETQARRHVRSAGLTGLYAGLLKALLMSRSADNPPMGNKNAGNKKTPGAALPIGIKNPGASPGWFLAARDACARQPIMCVGNLPGAVLYEYDAALPTMTPRSGMLTTAKGLDLQHVWENVVGLLSAAEGRLYFADMDEILAAAVDGETEVHGYPTKPRKTPTSHLPQLPFLRTFPRKEPRAKAVGLEGSLYKIAGVPPASWSDSPHCLVAGDYFCLVNANETSLVARIRHKFTFFNCCHLQWRNWGSWTGYATVECVDLPTMKTVVVKKAHQGNLVAMCSCDVGKVVGSAGNDMKACLFDVSAGTGKGMEKIATMDLVSAPCTPASMIHVGEKHLVAVLCGEMILVFDRRSPRKRLHQIRNVVESSASFGALERISESRAICCLSAGGRESQLVSVVDVVKGKVVCRGTGCGSAVCPFGYSRIKGQAWSSSFEAEQLGERLEFLMSQDFGCWTLAKVGAVRLSLPCLAAIVV